MLLVNPGGRVVAVNKEHGESKLPAEARRALKYMLALKRATVSTQTASLLGVQNEFSAARLE